MWIPRLKVKELENRITRLENNLNCSKGFHSWDLKIIASYDNPVAFCKHCYARPELKNPTTEADKGGV